MSDDAPGMLTTTAKLERTVTVQGIATRMLEAGKVDAPPLVYLHGTLLGNLWLAFHETLARDFHLYAPDIPGFGLTPRPDWMRDMSDYILYLRDLLDALALERAMIVGHSLGGWMAAEVAVWYPERVSKLALSNAVGIRVKGKPLADLFAMYPQEMLAASFDNLSAAAPLIPAAINEEYLMSQYRQMTTLASLAWNPSYDPKLERRLAWVKCPTLVIWGRNDRLVPVAYAEAFQKRIPNAELAILEGTGHMPMFEQHEEWSRVIREFLTKEM